MEKEYGHAKCPQCGYRWKHLADEYPDECPRCGWAPELPEGD